MQGEERAWKYGWILTIAFVLIWVLYEFLPAGIFFSILIVEAVVVLGFWWRERNLKQEHRV